MTMKQVLKYLLIAVTVLTAATAATAGNKINVDLDAIEQKVKSNPAGYTALLNRFVAGDTTLTIGEMATVYYGYAYTKDFNPDEHFDKARDAYRKKDYPVASYLSSEALVKNPVSLDMTVIGLVSATRSTVERIKANVPDLQARFDMLATIILSSGKGTDCDSPFMVLSADDTERIVKNVLGAQEIIGHAKVGTIDAVKMRFPGQDREHILYFSVTGGK